ncbi:MAG: cation:proton antiporter [Acidimicrobiia bacterium]|nr:cation:proton antiporter [Acidimicrobiia bacterium]
MIPVLAASESGGLTLLDEHQVFVFLIQLTLLVGSARLLGGIANKLRQPPVVGQLVAGVLIGPSVLGQFYPDTFEWIFSDSTVGSVIYGLAWLAVIMVLVVIGYETDLGIIMRLRKAAINVSAGAFLVPLVVVGLVALLTPSSFIGDTSRGLYAAFMALALSVAALPVVAKILLDLGMLRRNFGQVTLAVSMTMDSVGWLILAGLAGVAQEGFEPSRLLTSLGGLVLFVALAATIGKWALNHAMRLALRSGWNLQAALTVSLVAAIGGGAITHVLGLEAILGAFIVGIILATLRYQIGEVRHVLEVMTDSFFAPIFFAFSGLRVDISLLGSPSAIIWTVVLIVLAVAAKVFGTLVGARRAGLSFREGLALGSGLSALGAMGIVVALVGLSLGVLSDTGYTVIVLAAIITSLVAPIMLKLAVREMEAGEEEQSRLESEAIRSQAQILGSERILLPTRGGANSVYAANQIKILFPEAEVTVLAVAGQPGSWVKRLIGAHEEQSQGPEEVMTALGSDRHRLIRRKRRDPADAILNEAALGYDLVVLGATERTEESEVFSSVIDRVLAKLRLPTLIFRYPSADQQSAIPDSVSLDVNRVLLSVESNRASRAAEEIAYSLAAHNDGLVLALHLIAEAADGPFHFDMLSSAQNYMAGMELLEESVTFGERLGARVNADVKPVAQPEGDLVQTANTGNWDLLVMGATSRPLTNRPFFGYGMSYILKYVTIPMVIVAIPDIVSRYRPH